MLPQDATLIHDIRRDTTGYGSLGLFCAFWKKRSKIASGSNERGSKQITHSKPREWHRGGTDHDLSDQRS